MLEIDGSHGEGGGQVLRTALAISAATGTSVVVDNVRGERDPAGLKPQHLAAVRLLADMADAKVEGDETGSERVVFEPQQVSPGRYSVDIGTAGSVTLVAGAGLLAAATVDGEVELSVQGGTDVRWSPTYDYLENVTLPLLEKAGVDADARLVRRGHYPEGGGEIEVEVAEPGMEPLEIPERGDLRRVRGRVHVSNLPTHVAERMAESACENFEDVAVPVAIEEVEQDATSTGTSITLWAEYENTVLGASALGERGVPAEDVGERAARRLKDEMEADGTVDRYAADQLAPFVALAGGGYTAPEATPHLETCVWLCRQFLDAPEIAGRRVLNR